MDDGGTASNHQAYFGDLSLCATMVSRLMRIAASEQMEHESNTISFRSR